MPVGAGLRARSASDDPKTSRQLAGQRPAPQFLDMAIASELKKAGKVAGSAKRQRLVVIGPGLTRPHGCRRSSRSMTQPVVAFLI
jgi:hypothetical protein